MDITQLKKITSGLHVLFAEDSLVYRKSIQKMIAPFFKQLDLAVDGEDAFNQYREFHESNGGYYDILITDLIMPNLDGYALSKKVKDYNKNQNIIVISGENDLQLLIKLINLGIKKFVAKPIDEKELLKVIADVAEKIHTSHLNQVEQKEIKEYNEILKERESVNSKQYSEFYEALNESSIISRADIDGNITFVNDLFCKLSGYTKEELLGQNYRILKDKATPSSFYTKLWNTVTAKKTFKTVFKNRRKDGSIYYLEQLIKPILDIDGEIVEYIAIANDVSRLFISVQKETKLRESSEDFFRNIGHEMRTPLNAILGILPFLKKRLTDPKFSEMIAVIDESSHNLHQLIEHVLDIQKMKSGTLENHLKPFNPVSMINALMNTMHIMAEAKEQNLHTIMDEEDLPLLISDEKHISDIIEVIINNAIKFTPNRGEISCSMIYDFKHERLKISVKDSGIGIAKEDHEKIFALSQADGSLSRKYEGAGLGLFVASSLIKVLEGKISVHSTPSKKGSLFLVEIPCKVLNQEKA